MTSVTAHANSVSAERFGTMGESRLVPDTPLTPTLGTPGAFTLGLAAGVFISAAVSCADVQ
jgi:hypothetical protein